MAFEVGQIVEGKVTGIMNYGAFVDIGDNTSGMVHISEVAPVFVKEIKDHLTVGQTVKVKIMKIDENGKISLSIKQAEPRQPQGGNRRGNTGGRQQGGRNQGARNQGGRSGSDGFDWGRRPASSDNFEDMVSKFMASSDEKISGLKKDTRRSRKGGNNGGPNQW